jgi:hypothetical protein
MPRTKSNPLLVSPSLTITPRSSSIKTHETNMLSSGLTSGTSVPSGSASATNEDQAYFSALQSPSSPGRERDAYSQASAYDPNNEYAGRGVGVPTSNFTA